MTQEATENPKQTLNRVGEGKPKIYCWVNSGRGTDWQIVMAMSEDGHCLASHCSSHVLWAMHDIGISSDWKHEIYAKHYPNGFELVWVDDATPGKCPGLDAAYAKNQAMKPKPDAVNAPHAVPSGEPSAAEEKGNGE